MYWRDWLLYEKSCTYCKKPGHSAKRCQRAPIAIGVAQIVQRLEMDWRCVGLKKSTPKEKQQTDEPQNWVAYVGEKSNS